MCLFSAWGPWRCHRLTLFIRPGLAKSDDMSLTTWNACIIPRVRATVGTGSCVWMPCCFQVLPGHSRVSWWRCGDVPIQAGDMFLPVVITCGPSYPDKAPIVSFGDGFPDELKARLGKGRGNQIDPAKVAYLRAWNKKSTMRDLLVSMSSGL